MKRKIIPDDKVFHIWKCSDPYKDGCNVEYEISPDFYEENGEPMCENCDIIMHYDRTEIEVDE